MNILVAISLFISPIVFYVSVLSWIEFITESTEYNSAIRLGIGIGVPVGIFLAGVYFLGLIN